MLMAQRTVKLSTAHYYMVIFELGLPFDHRMMPWKFRDDICNGLGVIVLTNEETNKITTRHC